MEPLKPYRLVVVDPGLRGCGIATARIAKSGPREMDWAGYIAPGPFPEGSSIREIAARTAEMVEAELYERFPLERFGWVLEIPRHYPGQRDKLDGVEAVEAVNVQLIGRSISLVKTYYPQDWKGQVPKDIHHKRIQEALTPFEREAVEMPHHRGLHHNVWDAVGILLFHLKRQTRGAAITRS